MDFTTLSEDFDFSLGSELVAIEVASLAADLDLGLERRLDSGEGVGIEDSLNERLPN